MGMRLLEGLVEWGPERTEFVLEGGGEEPTSCCDPRSNPAHHHMSKMSNGPLERLAWLEGLGFRQA